jgi:hypothetical protein
MPDRGGTQPKRVSRLVGSTQVNAASAFWKNPKRYIRRARHYRFALIFGEAHNTNVLPDHENPSAFLQMCMFMVSARLSLKSVAVFFCIKIPVF